MKNSLCLFLFSISTSIHAANGFVSGDKIFKLLKSDLQSTATYETGLSTGYIFGVFDTMAGTYFCPPNGVSGLQIKQIVFNYMQAHPEYWDKTADYSVLQAFSNVWPCEEH